MSKSIFNPELLNLAQQQVSRVKSGFVDAATAQGAMPPDAGGGAPPADPMAGPMPPMPPMGGDPAAGGAPPAEGGGGMTPEAVKALVQEVIAQQGGAMGGGGAAGGAGGEKPKMKVDVNQEIYQIKKLLVLMAEEMGLPVPPTLLLGDPAQDPNSPPEESANDPLSAGYQPQSAISPIQPMGAASPALAGGGGGGGEAAKAATARDRQIHRGMAVDSPSSNTILRNTDTARALLAQMNAR